MKNVKEKKSNKKGTMDLKPQNILKLKKKKKLNSIISIPKFQQRVINEEWDLEKRIYFHLSTKRSKLKKKKRTTEQTNRSDVKKKKNRLTSPPREILSTSIETESLDSPIHLPPPPPAKILNVAALRSDEERERWNFYSSLFSL